MSWFNRGRSVPVQPPVRQRTYLEEMMEDVVPVVERCLRTPPPHYPNERPAGLFISTSTPGTCRVRQMYKHAAVFLRAFDEVREYFERRGCEVFLVVQNRDSRNNLHDGKTFATATELEDFLGQGDGQTYVVLVIRVRKS